LSYKEVTVPGTSSSANVAAAKSTSLASPPSPVFQTGGADSADFLYDELWSEPRNLVGSPRNRATDSGMIGAVLPEGIEQHREGSGLRS